MIIRNSNRFLIRSEPNRILSIRDCSRLLLDSFGTHAAAKHTLAERLDTGHHALAEANEASRDDGIGVA